MGVLALEKGLKGLVRGVEKGSRRGQIGVKQGPKGGPTGIKKGSKRGQSNPALLERYFGVILSLFHRKLFIRDISGQKSNFLNALYC